MYKLKNQLLKRKELDKQQVARVCHCHSRQRRDRDLNVYTLEMLIDHGQASSHKRFKHSLIQQGTFH